MTLIYSPDATTELQRYYQAAAEAAQDVMAETGPDQETVEKLADPAVLANEGVKPLDSPRSALCASLDSESLLAAYLQCLCPQPNGCDEPAFGEPDISRQVESKIRRDRWHCMQDSCAC